VIFSRELFFYPSKNYLFVFTRLFGNLKARILKSIVTWSEMGQQTAQAKKVYCRPQSFRFFGHVVGETERVALGKRMLVA